MSDPNKHPFDDIFPDDDQPDDVSQPDAETPDSDAPAPHSDAPPRIVAEAPLGGVARPVGTPEPPAAPHDRADASPTHDTQDPDADDDTSDTGDGGEAVEAVATDDIEDTADTQDATDAVDAAPRPPVLTTESGEPDAAPETPSAGDAPPPVSASVTPAPPDTTSEQLPPEPGLSPEAQIQARLRKLQAREAGEPPEATADSTADASPPEPGAGEVGAPASGEVAPSAPQPEAPPQQQPASSAEAGGLGGAQEWDEDLSPELAAVLFGGQRPDATPAERAPADAAPASPAPDAPVPSLEAEPEVTPQPQEAPVEGVATTPAPELAPEPAPDPEPDAPPIELTDLSELRTLPITAEGRAASAPDVAIEGRARYVRVEEPLDGDAGQRTFETWEYLKPDYATLDDREVREVTVEDVQHGDGSRLWRYERRYADRGRDSREVRANGDATYIEREDVVSRLDATGRRLQFKESAELIHAAPDAPEKKGGLLSGLGNLLGRDDEDTAQTGPRVWRQATASEVRQARKQGGEAFKRGLFEGLIG
jgi:hypothetical protein